jgi:hypothetical protein
MMVSLAAGTFMVSSASTAKAQEFTPGVRVVETDYRYGHDGYWRHDYTREDAEREAYLRHERWEREHRFERGYWYR